MAASTVLIAGRPVPSWIGHALWFLVMGVASVVTLRLESLPGVSASSPSSSVESGMSAVQTSARPQGPIMLELDRPMRHGDYVWNDQGVPAGRVEILVDIGTQILHVYRSGHEIGRAVILYGTEENPTPLGRFTITEKDIDHESNIYEAVMPYMMRLTNDGIAIHGAVVEYGKASRGCVGVPDEFAALLFAQARLGDQVRIIQSRPAAVSTAP